MEKGEHKNTSNKIEVKRSHKLRKKNVGRQVGTISTKETDV